MLTIIFSVNSIFNPNASDIYPIFAEKGHWGDDPFLELYDLPYKKSRRSGIHILL